MQLIDKLEKIKATFVNVVPLVLFMVYFYLNTYWKYVKVVRQTSYVTEPDHDGRRLWSFDVACGTTDNRSLFFTVPHTSSWMCASLSSLALSVCAPAAILFAFQFRFRTLPLRPCIKRLSLSFWMKDLWRNCWAEMSDECFTAHEIIVRRHSSVTDAVCHRFKKYLSSRQRWNSGSFSALLQKLEMMHTDADTALTLHCPTITWFKGYLQARQLDALL